MNRDMREDGTAVARSIANAYERDDPASVMREAETLIKSLLPWKPDFWIDDRTKQPILIDGKLPTPDEFVNMSASDSHGRHDPNELYATARAMKNARRNAAPKANAAEDLVVLSAARGIANLLTGCAFRYMMIAIADALAVLAENRGDRPEHDIHLAIAVLRRLAS